jgi:hypothetical protein
MKQILNIKWISTMIVLFTLATYTFAQGPRFGERLDHDLGLSETQIEQAEKLREEMRTEMQALRQQERRPELKEQMKEIMDQFHTDFESILTTEQKVKWKVLQANRKERMDKRIGNQAEIREHRKALSDEIKAYREANILPVLLEQRTKLESDLSQEDKAILSALREKLTTAKAKRSEKPGHMSGKTGFTMKNKGRRGPQGIGQGKPGFGHHAMAQHRGQDKVLSQDDKATLKGLVEKYEPNIAALMEAIEGEKEQWKKDIKYIHEKNKPEKIEGGKGNMKRNAEIPEDKKAIMEMKHKTRFLLLDPNQKSETAILENISRKVNVFPNPGSSQQKLEFEVMQSSKVTVEIIDTQGNIVKKVFSGVLKQGMNSIDVSIEGLKGNNYFYRITDAKGMTSTPVVIQ